MDKVDRCPTFPQEHGLAREKEQTLDTAKTDHGYVPIYIASANKVDITRCEVLPGVRLEKIPAYRLKIIKEENSRHPWPLMPFKPNYAVNIDKRKYRQNLFERLIEEGKAIEDIKRAIPLLPLDNVPPEEEKQEREREFDRFVASPFDIVKHVLMSILIIQPSPVAIGAEYTFRTEGKSTESRCRISNIEPLHLGPPDIHRLYGSAIYQKSGPRVNRRNITQLASKLDRYYRRLYWQVDRIAIALNSFWTGLHSTQLDQMFISITLVLEALLTTDRQEITHQIAERAALLLGKDASNRYEIYKQVKDLYSIRSKIVHGSAFAKKGRQTWESLMIDAKTAIVPVSKVKEAIGIASRLLRTMLCDQELALVMQRYGNESTASKNISELFQKRLFE